MLKVAIAGTGKRFFSHYVPILTALIERGVVDVTGVYNRTEERGLYASQVLNCRYFESFDNLLQNSNATALINLTASPVKHILSVKALSHKLHVFAETPAGNRVSEVRELSRLSKMHDLVVEIPEDCAFLPNALKEQAFLQENTTAQIQAVYNTAAAYAYHAFARLGMLVGTQPNVTACKSARERHSRELTLIKTTMSLSNGTTYYETMPDPKNHSLRKSSVWKVITSKGELIDGAKSDQDKQKSIQYLLEAFVASIEHQCPPAYGIERALADIYRWRIKAYRERFPYFPLWVIKLLAVIR